MTAELSLHIERAAAHRRRAVVHVVHGSKSGLTLPALNDVERLVATLTADGYRFVTVSEMLAAPEAP